METVSFDSHGMRCEAWWLPARDDGLAGPAGTPAVVMAHGFGCTRDSGLLPFARRFAAAGLHVLVFDYRGFGGSGSAPGGLRQDVDHRRHREDYHAALAAVRAREDVDADRVALWGTSYSGGHVVAVAAEDPRVAALVSQGAAMDGLAALTGRGVAPGPGSARTRAAHHAKVAGAVAGDLARAALRRPPRTLALFGATGSTALMTGAGATAFERLTGPTFRNEMAARGVPRVARNRPVRVADRVRCPALLVVAERDEIAPAAAVREVARRIGGRAEVASYDCGHFDLYEGAVFEESVAVQAAFLRRVLAPR
ncbi:alpha/beta hydrolase [Nocardioides marinquilinus]|uniref:alpha/beta hydrolase n=1 Tax=Nocardioides marinquilinus TaxID=1210400 RepID=UPI0031ED83ED